MVQKIVAFMSGLLFALGLGLSGMLQPQKIVGFLNIFGDWDPSLIFVMIGAISVHGLSFYFIKRKTSPLLGNKFHMPTSRQIDRKLLMGSGLFGIGWGISGFCPGPGITSLTSGNTASLIFVVAMVIGMFLYNFLNSKKTV